MKTHIAFFFVLLMLGASPAIAQELTKAENKEWKQKAKEYRRNPAQLKALSEERDRYFEEAHRLRAEVNMAQTELNQITPRLAQLEESNQLLNQRLLDAQETIRQLRMELDASQVSGPTRPVEEPTAGPVSGVVFRIQVGAFGKGKVPDSFLSYPDAMVEDDGNLQKVLIGNYRDYNAAKARLAELKSQGMSGAWIVPFKDGTRTSLEDAMRNQ